MDFFDLLSPLRRRKWHFIIIGILFSVGLFSAVHYLTQSEKVTIYFTVKAVGEAPAGNHFYSAEGAERMAETISGWAKDPSFRAEVLSNAKQIYGEEVVISNFKQKISARKQNRMNVFYTVGLPIHEKQYAGAITDGVFAALGTYVTDLNTDTPFPFTITEPQRFSEWQTIPWAYTLLGALLLGFGISFALIYLYEGARGRLMHYSQVEKLFPNAPKLFLQKGVSEHTPEILEPFLMQFQNPKIIGLFDEAESYFSLAKIETLRPPNDMPVLLTRLGETTLVDLQNMKSIVGNSVALIIYDA